MGSGQVGGAYACCYFIVQDRHNPKYAIQETVKKDAKKFITSLLDIIVGNSSFVPIFLLSGHCLYPYIYLFSQDLSFQF